MGRKLVVVALLSLAASAFDGFLCGTLRAETRVDRWQLQPQLRPSRPAVVGRAVVEPLSRRSVEYQMKARTCLRSQLSRVFPTVDTPRGLIVDIPASLLPSGHGLSRQMTEKLAQVAEALPPDVDVRVEGYTDERGSRAQTLRASSGLAETVRNVIEENDESPREIGATGFVSNTASKLHERR